jgi:hypothetical protein
MALEKEMKKKIKNEKVMILYIVSCKNDFMVVNGHNL